MSIHTHLIIMAGGIGSRFWPMSTPDCPKQFIDVLGCGQTLLQLTVKRFEGICDLNNIWVVTSDKYINLVKEQLPGIPVTNILLEPCMRNTAPCIAYATWRIKMKDANANLVFSPADHLVTDIVGFKQKIIEGLNFVLSEDRILTLGMKPFRPDTGYGYIEADFDQDVVSGDTLYSIKAFREKPQLAVAEEYLAKGSFFWNAGIFITNTIAMEKAFRTHLPNISNLFDEIESSFGTDVEQSVVNENFPLCNSISIDYGVMEKINNGYVLLSDFGWSDLGTWGSLHETMHKDESQNAVSGNKVKLIETSGCVVHMPENKSVVIQGLEDCIIAEKNNTLLICKLSEEQRIKEFSSIS